MYILLALLSVTLEPHGFELLSEVPMEHSDVIAMAWSGEGLLLATGAGSIHSLLPGDSSSSLLFESFASNDLQSLCVSDEHIWAFDRAGLACILDSEGTCLRRVDLLC